MRGQDVFMMTKSKVFIRFCLFVCFVFCFFFVCLFVCFFFLLLLFFQLLFLETQFLICLKGTLTQTRLGVGRVTLSSKGPMRGQYICFTAKAQKCYRFSFFFVNQYFWRVSIWLLQMITLISLEGTLTQPRMGVCRVTFPCKGPMRGQYLLLMDKSQNY